MILRLLKYSFIALGIALFIHFSTLFISMTLTRRNTDIEITYEYTSDGCTLFIDGDYEDCCEAHDRAYWQ